MTNTPTTPTTTPRLSAAEGDALEAMAVERARYDGSGLPGVVLSAATARDLIERGYAEVVHESSSLGSHRCGITRAGLDAYAAIGGDVDPDDLLPEPTDGAQRGRMVLESYDSDPTDRYVRLLSDLLESAEHDGLDFGHLVFVAEARVRDRS